MHAVIVTGGKQYRVSEGDSLRVEKLSLATGDSLKFDKVLLISDGGKFQVGKPYLDNGAVSAEVEAHGRGRKIEVVKFHRRKKYRRHQGHRQAFTQVRITGIDAG